MDCSDVDIYEVLWGILMHKRKRICLHQYADDNIAHFGVLQALAVAPVRESACISYACIVN